MGTNYTQEQEDAAVELCEVYRENKMTINDFYSTLLRMFPDLSEEQLAVLFNRGMMITGQ